jgi:hypothetical protein
MQDKRTYKAELVGVYHQLIILSKLLQEGFNSRSLECAPTPVPLKVP